MPVFQAGWGRAMAFESGNMSGAVCEGSQRGPGHGGALAPGR